ncbi:MAG: hypothetical protein FRX48_03479 [Lasallia pustulata]|uniref:protein-tyrosine-phosphatase n=1 Tax=Lasallia pustulata TaxID=136370 RepID=A0A5M8PSE3_9LECA|nr:MAG: hypothetical protein FRX48_03479 [Lasallia pustulata]
MSTATTTRPSPRTPWPSHPQPQPQSRSHKRPSSTPLGLPGRAPASVGQAAAPYSTKSRSPAQTHNPRAPSPSYFGLVVDPASNIPLDSNPGGHAKSNWSPPSSAVRSTGITSPRELPVEANQEFEAFRKQSETNPFSLGHGNLSRFSMGSGQLPTLGGLEKERETRDDLILSPSQPILIPDARGSSWGNDPMEIDFAQDSHLRPSRNPSEPSLFDVPRQDSPANMLEGSLKLQRAQLSSLDDRHQRLSLPCDRLDPLPPGTSVMHRVQRAETLPDKFSNSGPSMITPQKLLDLLKTSPSQDILLLDLRVFPQFSVSRLAGAINLCIPTTLLKRPSFNVEKLADTFTKEEEKAKFAGWKEAKYIVVYDASSSQLKDAVSSINTLKKFTSEGWAGSACVLRGGFYEFAQKFPDHVDKQPSNETHHSSKKPLSIDPAMPGFLPVAGGCAMPSTQTAANPFFGNIRQNMDLIGGVGQVPVLHPSSLTPQSEAALPQWIRQAAERNNKGKAVADRFLTIEKAEQKRMQKALSGNVCYGTPLLSSAQSVQIAGIEKGTKNRYKDMLPYDHSRVRLQNVPEGECDYVNASYIKAEWSNKHYIASQAPVPATFEDFWRMVWEQDVRVIVMLTVETEGGQRKSHPYWDAGDYGPYKVKSLNEKRVSLELSSSLLRSPPTKEAQDRRPNAGRRRSTNPNSVAERDVVKDASNPLSPTEKPHVLVRKLALSHSAHPFQPMREITQLHYSGWPDFGAPAHSTHVLGLVEHCNSVVRTTAHKARAWAAAEPEPPGQRPVVVHCSAGCGRTGTFCTVDSVVDILKRQRLADDSDEQSGNGDGMDVHRDVEEEWVKRDDVDLVARVVEDFRAQRLSMVQTLRQFVLCYETVLEWLVREQAEGTKKQGGTNRSHPG